ncbi:hypothetical protein [Pedobacter endophyticus]|uniref:Uncharacterized protein n=1 Tax=Pedobacter endophyticus TaxID=2789740 RepID=A0A7S9L101_9SPHI|nr:hypothetical protein [Pedobacter endophyticus]QPH40423.1 hypothetical protein IZT61_03840 [Pedobacter endophyticus]
MNTDPRENEQDDDNSQLKNSPNQQEDADDNDVQRGLTGEIDDEEDVSGDLAGNAGGNT